MTPEPAEKLPFPDAPKPADVRAPEMNRRAASVAMLKYLVVGGIAFTLGRCSAPLRDDDVLWETHRLYADDEMWTAREEVRFRQLEFFLREDCLLPQPQRRARFDQRLRELATLRADWESHAATVRRAIAALPPGQPRLRWALQHRQRSIETSLRGRFMMLEVLLKDERGRPDAQPAPLPGPVL